VADNTPISPTGAGLIWRGVAERCYCRATGCAGPAVESKVAAARGFRESTGVSPSGPARPAGPEAGQERA
jgi:hypothetical protein